MSERKSKAIRIVSVISATVIALACGTNYAYSAWGPQFAERMQLSSTQQNLIGTFANLGMYSGGIPVGLLVDYKGPKPGVIMGGALLTIGYFGNHRAFEDGPGSIALPWMCLFAYMTGIGGAAAFASSIKTSALNWPDHRGTATAFPLSAFGLGAFFFSAISSVAFPDNTSQFLLLLSIGCLSMCYVSLPFLRVVPLGQQYTPVPIDEERRMSNPLVRTKSMERKGSSPRYHQEPGTQRSDPQASTSDGKSEAVQIRGSSDKEPDETSSLVSKSTSSTPGDVPYRPDRSQSTPENDLHHVDIRGLTVLKQVEFYQLWFLLGILTGVGLMTINNIGNDASLLLKIIHQS